MMAGTRVLRRTDPGEVVAARDGMTRDPRPVLLYDGLCGFCDRTVRVLLRVDWRGVFRFAPLQGEFASLTLSRRPDLGAVDSIVLVEFAGDSKERVWIRSAAFIRTGLHLGGVWRLLSVFALIPRPVRDWAYDVLARRRYRIFGRFETCRLPAPEVRSRFLE